jgi:hypothetical protein
VNLCKDHVDYEIYEEEVPVISSNYIFCNYKVMSEQEIVLKEQPQKRPTANEINVEKDPILQYFWDGFRGETCEARKNKLDPTED